MCPFPAGMHTGAARVQRNRLPRKRIAAQTPRAIVAEIRWRDRGDADAGRGPATRAPREDDGPPGLRRPLREPPGRRLALSSAGLAVARAVAVVRGLLAVPPSPPLAVTETGELRASVGSTEAANKVVARFGVVGPTRASVDSTSPIRTLGRWSQRTLDFQILLVSREHKQTRRNTPR
jgi:hypothetical protein